MWLIPANDLRCFIELGWRFLGQRLGRKKGKQQPVSALTQPPPALSALGMSQTLNPRALFPGQSFSTGRVRGYAWEKSKRRGKGWAGEEPGICFHRILQANVKIFADTQGLG